MEKIKDAIEKAKNNRGAQASSRRKVSDTHLLGKFDKKNDELDSLTYSKTTVVQLDSDYLENNRIVAVNKNNSISWVFDSLRTQVLQKMEENNWRTLAIVSPTPESGKTIVSINLAISIAQQPQKTVVLVDFDLRKPRVASYLGLNTEKSLNDLLAGTAVLSDILVNPGISGLTILPTNRSVAKASETLSSNNIQNLISELRERYESRIVIIDLPPILTADDAMVLLPQVDCVLLVVSNGMNTESEIDETMRLLSKANLLGVVLNRVEEEPKSYYYD